MLAERHYQLLLDLSRRMLAAGTAQQWDDLVSLEEHRRLLLNKTPEIGPDDSPQPVIGLIREIQDCDAQLREKIDSWMADARILLRLKE